MTNSGLIAREWESRLCLLGDGHRMQELGSKLKEVETRKGFTQKGDTIRTVF